MSKLDDATKRLEHAVARLERAAQRAGGDSGESRRLAAALAQAKADCAALEHTQASVVSRLDATIERLNAVLEA